MNFIKSFKEKLGFGARKPVVPIPEAVPVTAPEVVEEKEEQESAWEEGIPEGLKEAFTEDRDISLGTWGEGPKTIGTSYGDRYYSYTQNAAYLIVYKGEKNIDQIELTEEADLEFLSGLFEQDISNGLRAELTEHGEFFTKDFNQRMLGVTYRGKRYEFYRDSREYADWAANIYNSNADLITSLDIREVSDVEFLETLFAQDNYEEE